MAAGSPEIFLKSQTGIAVLQSISTAGAGTITLQSDAIDISNVIDAGAGTVQFYPVSSDWPIALGHSNPGELSLTDSELDQVTAGLLRIGRTTNTNQITIRDSITAPATWSTLSLVTNAYVTDQTASEQTDITVTNLAIRSGWGAGQGDDLDLSVTNLAVANNLPTVDVGSDIDVSNVVALNISASAIDGIAGITNSASGSAYISISSPFQSMYRRQFSSREMETYF